MLSDTEKAHLQATITDLTFAQTTVEVLAPAATADDAYGRSTLTYPEPGEGVLTPGRVKLQTITEHTDGVTTQIGRWYLQIGIDVSISRNDRVLDTSTGTLFEVETIATHNTLAGVLWQSCTLVSVEPETT